jgi:hypothetical protein
MPHSLPLVVYIHAGQAVVRLRPAGTIGRLDAGTLLLYPGSAAAAQRSAPMSSASLERGTRKPCRPAFSACRGNCRSRFWGRLVTIELVESINRQPRFSLTLLVPGAGDTAVLTSRDIGQHGWARAYG